MPIYRTPNVHDERRAVGRLLALMGLGGLDQPERLNAELAGYVRDHAHFRELLMACEPLQRASMYDSLRSNLRFRPKPLDVYVSEAGTIAETMQWPIQDAAGDLHAFNPPAISTDNVVAIDAPRQADGGFGDADAFDKFRERLRRDYDAAFAKHAQEIEEAKFATAAVAHGMAKAHLWVVCAKCTREAVFDGDTREAVAIALRDAGWKLDADEHDQPIEICPKCAE
jgi:hypothetical protein